MLDINIKTEYDALDYEALFKCSLHETRTNVVVGHGPTPCDVMIIGEAPGEKEDLEGKPFIGKAGIMLTKILDSVGINRETEIYIANTVKCRPPENRNPKTEEIEACKPYLIRQIQVIKPRILILLGNPSLKTILGDSLTITKARGQWVSAQVDYMKEPLYIMPMFHPSFLLRNASKEKGAPKWLTWQDAKEVKAAMGFSQNSSDMVN
jgi:uracil-DNA glycosylase